MKERGPRRGSLEVCIVLGMTLATCALVASTTVIAVTVAPVVAGLLVIELDRGGGPIATGIVRSASRLLPKSARAENADEWADHVLSAGDVGLRPVLVALEIAIVSAPRIALRLRLRPLAGRYLLALFVVPLDVVRADPDERKRGQHNLPG